MKILYLVHLPFFLFPTPQDYKTIYPRIWEEILSQTQICKDCVTSTPIAADFVLEMNGKIEYSESSIKDVHYGKDKAPIKEFSSFI